MRLSERQQLVVLIVVFALVLVTEGVFGYFFLRERKEAVAVLSSIEDEKTSAEDKIKLIPSLLKKSEELAKIIDEYVAILPSEEDVGSDAFLDDIDRFTRDAGLVIKSAKPIILKSSRSPSRAGSRTSGSQKRNFVRHRYRFELEGNFFGLLKFIQAIENHSRFLQVDALDLQPLKSTGRSGTKISEIQLAEQPRKQLMVEISTYTYSKELPVEEAK